jgi:transposase-like protein
MVQMSNAGQPCDRTVAPETSAVGDGAGRSAAAAPSVLEQSRIEHYLAAFFEEYQPVGPTETALVRDLARRAAAMDLWGEAVPAVQRQAARALGHFAATGGASQEELDDTVLAGAMVSPGHDRAQRHDLGQARTFYRALAKLEETQAKRRNARGAFAQPQNPFVTEPDCEAYLAERFRNGKVPCPKCGSSRGHYLRSRRSWECAKCKRQTGLRAGTVMANSPIPLAKWFAAILSVLWRPTISVAELAEKVGIGRESTVRGMAKKLRTALASESASDLLAGLDAAHVGTRAHHLNQAPVGRENPC